MAKQIQCPNCGGFKISSTPKPIMNRTPRSVEQRIGLGAASLVILGIGYYLLTNSGDSGGLCAAPFVIIGLMLLAYTLGSSNVNKKVADAYLFTCLLCGYSWEWREGQPRPDVKIRPDLIAAGSKRLEQQKQQAAAIKCSGCSNTIPEGYSYCPYCGRSR